MRAANCDDSQRVGKATKISYLPLSDGCAEGLFLFFSEMSHQSVHDTRKSCSEDDFLFFRWFTLLISMAQENFGRTCPGNERGLKKNAISGYAQPFSCHI